MKISSLALCVVGLCALAVSLSGCLAVGIAGAAVGAAGSAVGATAKGGGAVLGAIIPGGHKKHDH
jgi:hypothetical protein